MTLTALLISLTLRMQTTEKPSIKYYQGQFEIHSSRATEMIPLEDPAPTSPPYVAFRKNDAFAVWDERGLTVRKGPQATSSRLPDIAVSPHAFTHDEIIRTVRRIRSGEYSKNATSLSGAKRIGKNVYFLLRWEDKSAKPWAEALVQVDLSADNPTPKLVGRFEGLSMANLPIDDKLLVLHGRLCIVSHTSTSWGLSIYDPETERFRTQAMGGSLQWLEPVNTTQALFVETSSYGTHIAGRVDLETGTRKIFYEGRERVKFIDKEFPALILATSTGKTKLINGSTSAVQTLPAEVVAKRTSRAVIVWSPKSAPSVAWLMDPSTWNVISSWKGQN